jgi:hypothetical protein
MPLAQLFATVLGPSRRREAGRAGCPTLAQTPEAWPLVPSDTISVRSIPPATARVGRIGMVLGRLLGGPSPPRGDGRHARPDRAEVEGGAVPAKVRLALLAAAAAGVVAIAGTVLKDRWDRWQLAQPLERRWGYEEHKRDCLDRRNERREVRARSCRSWQAMLEEERRRLLADPAAIGASQPRASEPP